MLAVDILPTPLHAPPSPTNKKMMLLPSPSTSTRPASNQRLPHAARAPTAASQARSGTPLRSQQHAHAASAKNTRAKPVSDKDGTRVSSRASTRRGSTAISALPTEKPPSKDGTAQMIATGIPGLTDYQLGDIVGRGAFGCVYRAINWVTAEFVAIKQIRFADLPKSELNTIMQEIDLLKNLNHPNIVKYQGSVRCEDTLYIILEFCENGSLHSICKNFGKFPENLVSLYTAQVLQGLLFLHEQGVIHRDIKGANILLTKAGLVKLADFGVATKQQGLAEGSVVGTPYWMAPEVIELSGATTASDIWSLGCTVIELLDGKPPYHKLAPMPALFRIVNDDHPPLPEGVSPLVRDFLMQCFQKDPNLRVSAKKLLKHPWIVSTKKAEKKKEPEYDEAMKSVQQWNEALKFSPPHAHAGNAEGRRSSARPSSRSDSRAAPKRSVHRHGTPALSSKPPSRLAVRATETFRSTDGGDGEDGDNWENDFESLSDSLAGLQLPDHRRPQDHFAGLLSSDKLKQYASLDGAPEMDGKVEEWDEEFEGDLTVRSPMHLTNGTATDTARPFFPPPATTDEIRFQAPSGLAKKPSPRYPLPRRPSKDSQPRTQIFRSAPEPAVAASKPKQTSSSSSLQAQLPSSAKYREDDDEDYSDLVPDNDDAFIKKLANFSPSRPFNTNDLRDIQNKLGGSVRRRTKTPTNLVHDAAAMRRSRSSVEMQKYAEGEEDDDFADCFEDDDGLPMSLHQTKTRSPKSISTGSDSANGSERGILKVSGTSSWIEDEEDEDDDPFAAMEEELDQVDLEENVARDKHARLCTLVEGLISDLKLSQPEGILGEIVEQLLQILFESPDVKSVIVSSHGMLPILEILDTCSSGHTIFGLLKIINAIISPTNVEVHENLCFIGGIPIISKFAHKKYAAGIRLEAAAIVRMMYLTSTLTLQMFISCGGLNVLVEFLEEDYDNDVGRELVLTGVNGVWSVFELQGPTPKNDFCRIFSRSSVLYPLSLVLTRILDEEGAEAEAIEERIVNIFLLFSQAENHVKETIAARSILKTVLNDLKRMRPQHQITMLKFIKNLSMLATTVDALHNSNAIEALTELLRVSMNTPQFREISNQVLNTMYNICRLNAHRQADAALSGIIPLLQRIVKTERPLKEFALPILCDMAHSGRVGRQVLWQNEGLRFYVSLLADPYWAVTALDAIFIWLQEETAKVEEHLLREDSAFGSAILQCFNESRADAFENLLEPLQKLLRLSQPLAACLADRSLFERSAVKVHAKKPLIRLNLLRVIRSICDASEEQGALVSKYGLLESVRNLARNDAAILVREMASDLVRSCEMAASSDLKYVGVRRSSNNSNMTPPVPLLSSGASTPIERAGSRSSYFQRGTELGRTRPMASSPSRPSSRDTSGSGASANNMSSGHWNGTSLAAARNSRGQAKPGIPRAQSRLGLAPVTRENLTPTHVPVSANTRSGMAAANARKRRQTSGAELGRQ